MKRNCIPILVWLNILILSTVGFCGCTPDSPTDTPAAACDDEDLSTYYRDGDGDSFGDSDDSVIQCAVSKGYVIAGGDCDDSDVATHPGAIETCDTIDNNCDGNVDEGLRVTYYLDDDGDGYGDSTQSLTACIAPSGYVLDSFDCNDNDDTIKPGAPELCDSIDNDCDGSVDEDLTSYYLDDDGDGYGSDIYACESGSRSANNNHDCNDNNAAIYPGAPDVSGDGVDSSCDGTDGQAPSVGLPTSAFTSIQVALDAALEGETVWVGPGTYLEDSLTMNGKALTLASTQGADLTVVNAQSLGSVLRFDNSEDALSVVRGFTLTGGNAEKGGGLLSIEASPVLEDLILQENFAQTFGGGFFLSGGAPTLRNVIVEHNSSSNNGGGGAFGGQTQATLESVQFRQNVAVYVGGGLYISSSRATLTDIRMEENRARNGGGLFMEGGELTVDNSLWRGNGGDWTVEPLYGGGVYLQSGVAPRFSNVRLEDNHASAGGGMYLGSSSPVLTNVTLTGNEAYYGGGMYLSSSDPVLTNVTLTGNVAYYQRGGGMYLNSSDPVLANVTLTGNVADFGGGMYLGYSRPVLTNVNLTGNSAYSGGGMYLDASSPTLTNVTLTGNSATVDYSCGGGMYLDASSPTLTNVTLTGNSAYQGGGMYLDASSPTLRNSIMAYNKASTGGNLSQNDYEPGTVTSSYSDFYNPPGFGTDDFIPTGTNTTVEPGFLSYVGGIPSDLHLAKTSPLINAGDPALTDPDGSRSDIGSYGGPDGDGWDVDGDGYFDYFWPGEWTDAPSGFDAIDYDCDDFDVLVQACL